MGSPKTLHFSAEVHAWLKRQAAARGMPAANFVEMCVRRELGARKKILETIPDGPAPEIHRKAFFARAAYVRKIRSA
jgi:hypothetical protein